MGAYQEIRPVEPVPAAVHRVIAEGMPVPRDGALLGWVSDRQAIVAFSVYHGRPRGPWPAGPQIRALPMVGSDPMHWPAFTVSPLDDGRLWDYLDRGELVDLAPVVAGHARQRVLGALAEHPPRRPGARLRRRQGNLPATSSGCRRRLHGPLDAPRGRPGAAREASPRASLAPLTWPAGSTLTEGA